MNKLIYKLLFMFFTVQNKVIGAFWRVNIHPLFRNISNHYALIRFLFRSINFIKHGEKCALGKKVILNCSNITLGSHVTLRSHVQIGGAGELSIGDNTSVNEYTLIACQKKVTIGANVMLAPYVYILDVDHQFQSTDKLITEQGYATSDVVIGDNVWIGTNTIITRGVNIGEGSIVGANSVVTNNIPSFSVYAGSPAKLIKMRKT